MDVVFLTARILFVVVFLGSAVGHLTQTDTMAGYASSRGVPAAKAATLVSGIVLVVGAVSVLLGLWGDLGALLLVLFLVPIALLMHGFWKETEPTAKQMEMIQFNKDISLAGGALGFFWAFTENPGLTLTAPLF